MCNLYSVTTNREALLRISQGHVGSARNLSELPGVYPDYVAPIAAPTQSER
jgi:hypothetical protein